MIRSLLIGGAVAALAVPALAQPGPNGPVAPKVQNQCFWVRDIYNYSVNGDEDTVYLRVRNHEIWKLSLASRCVGLSFKQALPIRTFAGVGSVCHAQDIDLKVRENGMEVPCFVSDLRKLTPEEAAAIPKRDRP